MVTYNYSNTSKETTLSAPIGSADTSMSIGDVAGLPQTFPYTLIVDYESIKVEVVTVVNLVGTTLTVSRGEDGTSATSHAAGARVVHGAVARDFVAMASHIAASSNVHGIGNTSAVVGTNTTQTLTNKSMDGANNTFTNIPDSAIGTVAASKIIQPFARLRGVGADGTLTVLDVVGGEVGRTANVAQVVNGDGKGLLVGVDGVVVGLAGNVRAQDSSLIAQNGGTPGFTATKDGVVTALSTITAGGKIKATAGGLEATAGGLLVSAGGATITGNSSITGTTALVGNTTVTGTVVASSTVKGTDFTIAGSPDRSTKGELDALKARDTALTNGFPRGAVLLISSSGQGEGPWSTVNVFNDNVVCRGGFVYQIFTRVHVRRVGSDGNVGLTIAVDGSPVSQQEEFMRTSRDCLIGNAFYTSPSDATRPFTVSFASYGAQSYFDQVGSGWNLFHIYEVRNNNLP